MTPLLEIAERVAAQARPDEQVEAYVVRGRSTSIRAYGGEVEKFSQADSGGIGVRVIVDQREGFAYAGSLDNEGVAFALREARDNATFAQADEALALPGPDDAGVPAGDLDLWRDEMPTVPPEDKVRLAIDLERATRARDPRIRQVDHADYGDSVFEVAVANSLGVRGHERSTGCSASVSAIAGEGDDSQTGYGFTVGRTFSDLDVDRAVGDAVERSTRMLGAKQVPTARLPVVLDPLVAKSFVGLLGTALSGESLSKGRSFFAHRVGEQVAAPGVTLSEDPTDFRTYGAAAFDGEGVATRPVALIDGGRLRGFVHSVVSARRVGGEARTTGSATRGYSSTPGVGYRNLHLNVGTLTLAEVLEKAGTALYVQSVMGLHSGANPISGDFSASAEGLMIRAGALAEPVREITIASTLQRMLLDIVEVGGDVHWLPSGPSSSLLVGEMTIGGA